MTKARDLANAGTALTSVSATELSYLDGVTSAVQTQLNQKPEFTAGKNAIINGDFRINQRSFTSNTTTGTFMYDRWTCQIGGDGTSTFSAQTFTPGTAPVSGYEGANYLRVVTSGQTSAAVATNIAQRIESVRTFAGQTVTLSFWAKANTGTPKIALDYRQNYGSGGSPSATVTTVASQVTINTSWTRYSITTAIPSISGKTLGTTTDGFLAPVIWFSAGSDFDANTGSMGIQNNTFEIWGVQLEVGSTATPFQTATGTKQGELAACQRYYYRFIPTAAGNSYGTGFCDTTTLAEIYTNFPVQMRTNPSALEQSGTAGDYSLRIAGTTVNCSAVPTLTGAVSPYGARTLFTVASGLTAGDAVMSRAVNTSGYLGWSAEL